MFTFKQFLEYKIDIPNHTKSKGIVRKDMPQITDKNHEDFIEKLKKEGIRVRKKSMDPKKLKPTQKEFSKQGIEKNIGRISKGTIDKKPPIIVSKDGYIMDGHHRWAARANTGQNVNVFEVDLKSSELLKKMNSYDKVKYKDIYNRKEK